MSKKVIFAFFVFFLSTDATYASYSETTNAVKDGIGYRTNLIDPLNPYATSPHRMTWALLKRYDIIPPDTKSSRFRYAPPEATSTEYELRVRGLLTEDIRLEFPKYLYGYGICGSNGFSAALAFIEAAVKKFGRSTVTDRLITARHSIFGICNLDASELSNLHKDLDELLMPLRASKNTASWAAYIDGAVSFYTYRFDEAQSSFSSIRAEPSSWLKDTADYLAVRIAMADEGTPENLLRAIRTYLKSHPMGRYAETVRHLVRHTHWLNDDRTSLVRATHKEFARIVADNSQESFVQKMSFLHEAIFQTEAIFELPMNEDGNGVMHPIAIVAALLAEISNEGPRDNTPSHEWQSRFDGSLELGPSYPGLINYFDLLLLVHGQKFGEIASLEIDRGDYGSLHGDALVLKARALGRTERWREAADLWINVSKEYALYNALTEVATAYVHRGKFVDFSRLEKSWMTNLYPEPETDDRGHYDEFDVSVKAFHARQQPYRNLLRAGFETIVPPEAAKTVYSDATLDPLIRFFAAEPLLRASLLTGSYVDYTTVVKQVFDREFGTRWATDDDSFDSELIAAYRYISPKIETLARNPNDADALMATGYFLYSMDRYPTCAHEVTLWELSLGICDTAIVGSPPSDHVRPIDLLSKALSLYKSKPTRTPGEAKVLRILIFCFKGNESRCVRGADEAYPRSVRKGYFQRLHKYFPQAAKKTPYWY